ncbi:MAG: two pore domain potassium channel family protein [Ardenticatenales bacterium]|nr:two pore domain potassium channel family protein [Ardenticatenales bacterium]
MTQITIEATEKIKEWRRRGSEILAPEERAQLLCDVIELHAPLEESDPEVARRAEQLFLLLLRDEPTITENVTFRRFIIDHIDSTDFYRIHWDSSEQVITVAEVLYGFRFQEELPAEQLTLYVRHLLRHALRQFEREEDYDSMFDLLQRAPIPVTMMDPELVRLRNRLYLHEMRRVRHKRQILYAYLLIQIALVLVLFPLLFIYFENGALQESFENVVEKATGETGVPESAEPREPRQYLSYGNGLYWTIITYSSIGYGDIAPVTDEGKMLAAIAGLMGVLTTGVIAGLILNWITPRDLT